MADQHRCKGYVSGQHETQTVPKSTYWKVRVKDPSCPYNGKWLVVASVRNDIALAKGLNVTFVIGSFDGGSETTIYKAVDVQIEPPTDMAPVKALGDVNADKKRGIKTPRDSDH